MWVNFSISQIFVANNTKLHTKHLQDWDSVGGGGSFCKSNMQFQPPWIWPGFSFFQRITFLLGDSIFNLATTHQFFFYIIIPNIIFVHILLRNLNYFQLFIYVHLCSGAREKGCNFRDTVPFKAKTIIVPANFNVSQ